jgi:hypothetical protein
MVTALPCCGHEQGGAPAITQRTFLLLELQAAVIDHRGGTQAPHPVVDAHVLPRTQHRNPRPPPFEWNGLGSQYIYILQHSTAPLPDPPPGHTVRAAPYLTNELRYLGVCPAAVDDLRMAGGATLHMAILQSPVRGAWRG